MRTVPRVRTRSSFLAHKLIRGNGTTQLAEYEILLSARNTLAKARLDVCQADWKDMNIFPIVCLSSYILVLAVCMELYLNGQVPGRKMR